MFNFTKHVNEEMTDTTTGVIRADVSIDSEHML